MNLQAVVANGKEPRFSEPVHTTVCLGDCPVGNLAHRSSTSVPGCRHSSLFFRGFQTGRLDMARKAESLKETNAIVIDIDLIPGQPMTG